MKLKQLGLDFSVCQIKSVREVDFSRTYVFLSQTDEELSLVCETASVPGDATAVENGWKGLKIEGVLDFSMIGVISKISGILADNNISIFVISTYNTDYIFLKAEWYNQAVALLRQAAYTIR